MDKKSTALIQLLHPSLRQECLMLCGKVEQVLTGKATFIIISSLRTMSEQLKLFNQGRTTPGEIVTNSRPGQSYHNYGMALDFALVVNGKTIYNIKGDFDADGKSDWMEVVEIFKAAGWKWGGDFHSIKDYPHFEKSNFHWRELWQMHVSGKTDKEGYIIL